MAILITLLLPVFLIQLSLIEWVSGATTNMHPRLRLERDLDNAGLMIKLNPSGLAYLRELGMSVVNNEIPKLKLPPIAQGVDGGQGFVRITNAKVTGYRKPRAYHLDINPPDSFTWIMEEFDVGSTGGFNGWYNVPILGKVNAAGKWALIMTNMEFQITVQVTANDKGYPELRAGQCRFTANNLDMRITDAGIIGTALNLFKSVLIAKVKPLVQSEICRRIPSLANNQVNNIVKTMPLTIKFGQAVNGGRRKRQSSATKSRLGTIPAVTNTDFIGMLTRQPFVLDYRLTRDPLFGRGDVAVTGRHVYCRQGTGGTPFGPVTAQVPRTNGDYMMEFYGTDYLVNSLLYHAYDHDLIKMTVNRKNLPQLAQVLSSDCSGGLGFCIGDVLWVLGQRFPGSYAEIAMTAIRAPAMFFSSGNGSVFDLYGNMQINAQDPKTGTSNKVLTAAVNLVFNVTLLLMENGKRVGGKVKVHSFTLKLKETAYPDDVKQADLDDIAFFGGDMIGNVANTFFGRGLPIPSIMGVTLRNPTMTMLDRMVRVQSYFEMDTSFIDSMIQKAMTSLSNG